MNWGKAKNKLIILFISINLSLAWVNYRKESGIYTLKESKVNDIIKILQENNIYVDCDIPKGYKPLQKLTVLPYQINSTLRDSVAQKLLDGPEGITVSIETSSEGKHKSKRIYRKKHQAVIFDGENVLYFNESIEDYEGPIQIKQAKKTAEKWLSQIEYNPKEMHVQIIEQQGHVYMIYYDKYDGVPIFDSYVKMHITPLGVKEVKIHKVSLGELIGSKETIYSADQVFFSLMQKIAQSQPIHIKDIVIGYALENPKGTHLIAEEAIPFYQVILESGETYYINAYTNELRDETPPIMDDLQ